MIIHPAGARPSRRPNPAWFVGDVWMDPIAAPQAPARADAVRVRFDPGARTNWHTHPLGQTLIVESGLGRAQSAGGPVRLLRPGDVAWFAPGERHWHGADPAVGMTHIAIQEALDGVAADWAEPVSEADYAADPA